MHRLKILCVIMNPQLQKKFINKKLKEKIVYIKCYEHTQVYRNSNNVSLFKKIRSAGGSTPQGGSLSYSRNPNSIPESLPAIPSVGSPGSAGPSPHPNSSLSQPTSVPPPDQVSKLSCNFIIKPTN